MGVTEEGENVKRSEVHIKNGFQLWKMKYVN